MAGLLISLHACTRSEFQKTHHNPPPTTHRNKITEASHFLPLLPSLAATTDQESP